MDTERLMPGAAYRSEYMAYGRKERDVILAGRMPEEAWKRAG